MKKLALTAVAALMAFTCCGCSYYLREPSARDIVKPYILVSDTDSSEYENAAAFLAAECSGAVVSVVSTYYVSVNGRTERQTVYSSGIVLNSDGYILTSESVAMTQAGNNTYESSSVQAVLAPVYEDDTAYSLEEVDRDDESGLALYKFYDNFYYTDASGERQDGLQFTAHLSGNDVAIGEDCWAIGNSLGDLFTDAYDLTIVGGIVSDDATDPDIFSLSYNDKQYDFMQTTIPTTPEMLGGGLFDENGYLIGMFCSKIVSETGGEQNYLDKSSLFYKTDIIQDYVNDVSEEKQTVIRLHVAVDSDASETEASAR